MEINNKLHKKVVRKLNFVLMTFEKGLAEPSINIAQKTLLKIEVRSLKKLIKELEA